MKPYTMYLAGAFLFIAGPFVSYVHSQATKQDLKNVHKLYIGTMGKSDEADRFRILLGDELVKKGFTVEADATLSGVLTVRVYDDESTARVTVVLSGADGSRLWSKDFGPHFGFKNKRGSDPVGFRAQDVAAELRKILGQQAPA